MGEQERQPEGAAQPVLRIVGGTETSWKDRLVYRKEDGTNVIVACTANVTLILTHDPSWKDVLAWDEFSQAIVATRPPPWDPEDVPADPSGPWRDSHAVRLQSWLARHYALHLSPKAVYDAALVVAEGNIINPVKEWADGIERDPSRSLVDGWLSTYLGAPDTPYTRLVGRCFLISAMARIYEPGCKVDTMPVFEGKQGLGKSTALRVLFGDRWFSDTPLDLGSKDRFVSLRGLLAHEFAELDAFTKAEASRVKSFISSQFDDFRPPYGQHNVRVPRRCVFAGTVNPGGQGYLRDETGNRRFWPVPCAVSRPIDLAALRRDREQLWAEARDLCRAKASWWPSEADAELCAEEQTKRVTLDVWDDPIRAYLRGKGPSAFVKVSDILTNVLTIDRGRWSPQDQSRVAASLVKAGWVRRQRRIPGWSGEGSPREWGYVPGGAPPEDFD